MSARGLLLFLTLGLPLAARAEPLQTTSADTYVTFGGAGLWIASELAKPRLAPQACRWCDEDVNAWDRATRQALLSGSTKAMSTVSDLGGYLLMPLSAGLLTLAGDQPSTALLLVAESLVITANVNQAAKLAVGRSRPYARYGNDVGVDSTGGDDHLSFFSGHAATSFSLASATYAWMRAEGKSAAPYAGGAMFAGAAFVGYTRIAADRHYLTDVLVGAAVGSAIGWYVIDSHKGPAVTGSGLQGRIAVVSLGF